MSCKSNRSSFSLLFYAQYVARRTTAKKYGSAVTRNTFRVIRVINIHKKKRERLIKLIFCLPCSIGPEAD